MIPPIYILAGGLGTRIANSYPNLPKALIPICGEPFIYWKILQLLDQGFTDLIFLLGFQGKKIQDYVEKEFAGENISFVYDGENNRGTAGAVSQAIDSVKQEFMLTFGDTLLPTNAAAFLSFAKCRQGSSMIVTNFCGPSDKFNIQIDGDKIQNYDKSGGIQFRCVDYGLYFFRKSDWDFRNPEFADLGTVIQLLAKQGKLFAWETSDPYFEIGTLEGIEKTKRFIERNMLAT